MSGPKKIRRTATEILDERLFRGRPRMEALLAEEEASAEVAGLIYAARMAAGLSQQELAERVGTTKSVISRLEDADYRGHSLAMVRRIGKALGLAVRVSYEPLTSQEASRVAESADAIYKATMRFRRTRKAQ